MRFKDIALIPKNFTIGLIRQMKANLMAEDLRKHREYEYEKEYERKPDGEYQRTEMGFGANIH